MVVVVRKLATPVATLQAFGQVSRSEREHPRYAHEASVTLHAGKAKLQGRTINVSRGGLCVDLAQKCTVGQDVEVDLVLIFDGGTESEPLRVPARVVWCTAVDDAYQVGVCFRPLETERSQYLTMFLRYLDDGSDGKKPRTPPPASVDDRFR